jgi:pyruvate/2-oxoglutarate/acetoin dehydrogenase E1 component
MLYGIRSGNPRTYGGGAAAQHSQTLYSILAHIPGLKVIVPSTAYNAKGLTISAIRDDGPVVLLEHRHLGTTIKGIVPEEPYTIPIGKAEVIHRGSDITLCGIGQMTHLCLAAAEMLAAKGISAEVVDILTLAPLDEDTPTASMARDIAARIADKGFDFLAAPIKTITAPETPIPFASVLEACYVPQAEQVVAEAWSLLKKY